MSDCPRIVLVALVALLAAPVGAAEDNPPACPPGQFADAVSGFCFDCRPGFWRNPALSPETVGACYSPARRDERPARRFDRVRDRGCPGNQFEYRGHCYRCDFGFDQNRSFPPDRRGACFRDLPDREEPALRKGPIGGPAGVDEKR